MPLTTSRDLRVGPSLATTDAAIERFSRGIYEEHIEEAALLYAQRATLLADAWATGWKKLASFESRLEAHFDALIVGGERALDVWSSRRINRDDVGELYVGSRLLARHARWDALREIAWNIEPWTRETVVALADAFMSELSHASVQALDSLVSSDSRVAAAVVSANGALRNRRPAEIQKCPVLQLAIVGGTSATDKLLHVARNEPATETLLLALGLLGDVRVIPPLLACLGDHPLAPIAAQSLDLITGASLMENVVIPGDIHDDELFENEERASAGSVSATRLSQAENDWRSWWSANQSRFSAGSRCRRGRLSSRESLLAALEEQNTPHIIRQATYDELVVRYGIEVPFSTRMTVTQQTHALGEMQRGTAGRAGRP